MSKYQLTRKKIVETPVLNRKNTIQQNLQMLLKQLPETTQLIAVSKTFPASDIKLAYELGQRDFGENKVQELLVKSEEL